MMPKNGPHGLPVAANRLQPKERATPVCYNVGIMRKTSVRELHIHTSELVREASDGGIIVIERRGVPVAELRPISSAARMTAGKKARIFTSMRKIWARMPQASDSTKILEKDRSR
jgi:prevent-host-death family protein